MGWRVENAVMVLGAILIGTFGAVLLSPGQLLLGPGALVLSEAADAVRQDRAQPAFGANSMSSGFSVRGSYRGTPTFTPDGVAIELSRAMAITDGSDDTQSLVGIRISLAERSDFGGW
jgi:hypothetical protein